MSDNEDLSPEELMCKQHRKEKKELQGKIQGLKKQASKGDKKKKKEIQEEVAKMEQEMDARHEQELKDLQGKEKPAAGEDETEAVAELLESATIAEPGERVSKAQKRRDKKAQKDKDRLVEIALQDEQNKFGVRQIETDKITAVLVARNLGLVTIPSDGDCLFAGLADQLSQKQGLTISVKELRARTVAELRNNANDYLMFLTHPTTGDMLTEAQFDKYCHDMEHTAVWGGQVEISALSKTLCTPIEVLQAEGPPMLIGEDFKKEPLVITYHRHMFGLGEHYNSTRKVSS